MFLLVWQSADIAHTDNRKSLTTAFPLQGRCEAQLRGKNELAL